MNRLRTLVILLLCAVTTSLAQNVNTPYSMYGYGILGDRATSMQTQMGGVGYAMQSGRQINVMNPASYACIDSLTFLFDMGANVSMLWNKEGDARRHSTGGGLDYLTMQFPICKYMGGSIGLVPYSSIGYAFGNDVYRGTMENQGTGGINEAYVGVSGRYAGVSLGVNVAYSFGKMVNDIYANPENSGQTLFEHVMRIRDWNLTVGLQYDLRIDRHNRMTLGLTYSPKKSLHGNSWATIQEITQDSYPDTLGSLSLKGNYYTPNSYGVGISYTHERASRFMVEADFTFQEWSKVKYSPLTETGNPDNVLFSGMKFRNRTKYALGVEYVPRIRGSYAQRIAIRAGGYYVNDYLDIRGNGVREYGVNAGVGLPTIGNKTIVNVGLGWKCRKGHPAALVSENYFNVTLGVNFNELWFWQRKIR